MAIVATSNRLSVHLTSLLNAVPGVQQGDEEAVHAARVASRRLRERLPVEGADAKPALLRRARTQVRRITRALGPVRELDVALGHLAEFAEKGHATPRAVAHVRGLLERQRRAQRLAMLAMLTPSRLGKLQKRVNQLSRGVRGASGRIGGDAVTQRVQERAGALSDRIEQAGALYVPERLHAVRIAAKKLRYALEIDLEMRRSRATAALRLLKNLQERLGRMHDLEVLIEQARAAQESVTAVGRELSHEIDALIGALERETRKLHASYMARRESVLKLCEALLTAPAGIKRRPAA